MKGELEFTVEDWSDTDVARLRGIYEPLTESVRALVDATIRTEADAATVAEVKRDIDAAVARLRERQIDGAFGVRVTSASPCAICVPPVWAHCAPRRFRPGTRGSRPTAQAIPPTPTASLSSPRAYSSRHAGCATDANPAHRLVRRGVKMPTVPLASGESTWSVTWSPRWKK